jgi:hypothetical protein
VNFYLGTHMPHWLTKPDMPPMFVSVNRLTKRKTMPTATCRWALDSGGFTELSMHGRWTRTTADYIILTRRFRDEIGGLDWAAPQDWMCEPWIVANTGLTVDEHQRRTIDNYHQLTTDAPDLPFIPVLQGWTLNDYHRHIEMYGNSGVHLSEFDTVGLGSVCRRQATAEIGEIVATLATRYRLKLHGFGVKGDGLRRYGWLLKSADSMAWSSRGRRINPCPHGTAKSCANCLPHALEWRHRAISTASRPVQLVLS